MSRVPSLKLGLHTGDGKEVEFQAVLGLHVMCRLILILYCLASIFKTIIDTISIYSFRCNIKIVVTRM